MRIRFDVIFLERTIWCDAILCNTECIYCTVPVCPHTSTH